MDTKYLSEIKAREQKATLEPWDKNTYAVWDELCEEFDEIPANDPDAQFIIHSRTDIPALISEVEQLAKENKLLKESSLDPIETAKVAIALQKNATLKKALELACDLLTKYTCFKSKGALFDYFIRQAQEQEEEK